MFQENLRTLRRNKGITQEELAARLNVVRQTISKWEKGQSVPDAEMLTRLAEIFEVPVSQLLGGPIEPDAQPDALAEQLRAFTEKVESSFLVDKLDYLVKGGRCSSAAALGANLLNLKPCIEVRAGRMTVVKKYRGNYAKCLASYVKERLADREDIDRTHLFITSSVISEDCYQSVTEAVNAYGGFANVYETSTGCTVACHCGPGTLGVLFVRK